MNLWKNIQNEKINDSINNYEKDIIEQDISFGNVKGTIYFRKNAHLNKAVLMVPGISGNRYSIGFHLGKKLARYGYFCLAIDLPSHYKNENKLTLGEISQEIQEAIYLIRNKYNIHRISVLGYSLGATAALFSMCGYNKKIENTLYSLWNEMQKEMLNLENISKSIFFKNKSLNKHSEEKIESLLKEQIDKIENTYTKIKQIILETLKENIQNNMSVCCYIFLAPPPNVKGAIPFLPLLKKQKFKTIKKVIDVFLHKPLLKEIHKEGNKTKYIEENKEDYIYWQFFKTKDVYEFLDYLLNLKEPADFLKLIEDLINFKHKDDKISFFEYYQKKYIYLKPKLFIYGNKDLFLKSFLPFSKRRIESFYYSFRNALIARTNLSHVMMKNKWQVNASASIENDEVAEIIMRFLDNPTTKK